MFGKSSSKKEFPTALVTMKKNTIFFLFKYLGFLLRKKEREV